MNDLSILFLRHGATTPLDKTVPVSQGDPARVLTSEGIARAEEVATDLASQSFGLMITSGVSRTVQTGAIVAAKQQKLVDIMSIRSLYMPLDQNEVNRLFALFDKATTPRLAQEVMEIRSMCEAQAEIILAECKLRSNPYTLAVNHMVLIQLIAHAMGASENVLDAKLEPCDGLWVNITAEGTTWLRYSAPKAA